MRLLFIIIASLLAIQAHSQSHLVIYSDESEMFRITAPATVKTVKYHNLITIKSLPFQELKLSLLIGGKTLRKNVHILKNNITYYALSKELDRYYLRYRGSLPNEFPPPVYLTIRNHQHTIIYRELQFKEVDALILPEPENLMSSDKDTTRSKIAHEPYAKDKIRVTPKTILSLIEKATPAPTKNISDDTFLDRLRKLQKGKTDSEKLILSKRLFKNVSLRISDIVAVCEVFSYEFTKADFAIYAYPICQDPENYQELPENVNFELIKELINRETKAKSQK